MIQGGTSRIKAFAEINLEDYITIKGFKIVEDRNGGIFVGFPSQKAKHGIYRDLVINLILEIRNQISDKILDAFRNFY